MYWMHWDNFSFCLPKLCFVSTLYVSSPFPTLPFSYTFYYFPALILPFVCHSASVPSIHTPPRFFLLPFLSLYYFFFHPLLEPFLYSSLIIHLLILAFTHSTPCSLSRCIFPLPFLVFLDPGVPVRWLTLLPCSALVYCFPPRLYLTFSPLSNLPFLTYF